MKGIIGQECHIFMYVYVCVCVCVCVYEVHITGFKKYIKYGINEALFLRSKLYILTMK